VVPRAPCQDRRIQPQGIFLMNYCKYPSHTQQVASHTTKIVTFVTMLRGEKSFLTRWKEQCLLSTLFSVSLHALLRMYLQLTSLLSAFTTTMISLFLVSLLTSYTLALPREDTGRPFVRIKRSGPPNHLSQFPPADSIPVLKPRHQRDHDFVDFKHLKPGSNGTFYYSHPHHEGMCRHLYSRWDMLKVYRPV
jgi:hypothetical protein